MTDGKPTLIGDDNKEFTIDAIGAQTKITQLSTEAAGYRKKASERGSVLEAIPKDILDNPTAAMDALKTVASMGDDHKADMNKLKTELEGSYSKALADKDTVITGLQDNLFESNVKGKFATSKQVARTVLTPSIAFNTFKDHFSADGSAKDYEGNTIFAKEKPGSAAGIEESLGYLIDNHPEKGDILKGSGVHGSGSGGGGRDTDTGGEVKTSQQLIKAGLDKRK